MKILILFLAPLFMFAHSLSVTSSYEDGELFIESFYGDGNPCRECTFTVTNGETEVYKNKLDNDGVFEKPVELKTPFSVHIDGGMGHWADVKIEGDEMGSKEESADTSTAATGTIDEGKLREIIRSELTKQNSKIQVMVQKNRSNLEKMLVGLGYILGIFGLWQLFARRKQK